jgi:hypothetical protein
MALVSNLYRIKIPYQGRWVIAKIQRPFQNSFQNLRWNLTGSVGLEDLVRLSLDSVSHNSPLFLLLALNNDGAVFAHFYRGMLSGAETRTKNCITTRRTERTSATVRSRRLDGRIAKTTRLI